MRGNAVRGLGIRITPVGLFQVISSSCDVAIVGGAAIGSAVAYFLKAELGFGGSVVGVERDPTYQHSATALSAASIRQQFSTPENIKMSQFGIEVIRTLKDRFGQDADIGFHEGGYLLLASPPGREVLRRNWQTQRTEVAVSAAGRSATAS